MAGELPQELQRLLDAGDAAARERAWEAFLSAHSRLLLHIARRLSSDRDAAMDAFTGVLDGLRLDDYRRLRAYAADGRSKFSTWLVVVAQRLCLDWHRHRYGRARDAASAERDARAGRRRLADLVAEDVEPDRLSDPAVPDHAAALQAQDLSRALLAARHELPPSDQLLLTLRFDDELSVSEIARILGWPTPFHVYRRLNTVFAALRRSLRRRGVEESTP